MNDARFRRPARLDQRAAEELAGESDPALRDEVAHTTARAVVHRARAAEDPAVVERLVRLVETEGLDAVAALWADAAPVSLPGALWRLYVLREWVRRDPQTVTLRYRLGVDAAPVHEAVAGVPAPPGPEDLRTLADAVLSGVYAGDLAVALERAASFCRILATGAAFDADAREVADPDGADRLTRGGAGLQRTAEELEHAARYWRSGALE
ncbi:hypothetical protein Xcel_0298 [Xylanimonas cellulosilytica DSM 15894]|uniref:DNA-directed RNA polymerase subunit beta n=1 Tax=Xylanimonas cellulosilytica (strain DSM 15894 / JCM 12276 / CECT 5975 / KCTC 9989 / LMG 20990 / NBRC 107835 / XIL07) TaxID=446471 RepID=D1BUU6_XYLCX|nr:hypothetical protein [Xylanimonas cellulosilytica]ACZ29337.1 hypothetical protein Xcel_0298 [Xylanimonas cellulosilytica DSM 15894]